MMANYSDVQRQWLAGNADALGYEFLDPTVFMQKRAAEGPLLYFPSDIHLTAAGHTALAEAVEDRIRSSLEISKAAE
jgi:lysophospholipase L1-like esterase